MRKRTKYTLVGVVAIVAVFAAVYYFFLKGTPAGEAIAKLVRPRLGQAGWEEHTYNPMLGRAPIRVAEGPGQTREDAIRVLSRSRSGSAKAGTN